MSQTFQALKMSKEMWKLFKHSKYPWRCDNLRLFQNLLGPTGLQSPTVDFGSQPVHTHTWGYKQANPRKWDEAPTTIAVVDQAMWWWWQAKICGHVSENSCAARLSSAIVSDLFRLQLSLIYVNGFKQCFLSAILILSAIFSDFVQRLSVSTASDSQQWKQNNW